MIKAITGRDLVANDIAPLETLASHKVPVLGHTALLIGKFASSVGPAPVPRRGSVNLPTPWDVVNT